MLRVALTGGIASGKTTVSDRFNELGAWIIDADVLAREVVEPGTPGFDAVVRRFGEDVVRDGALDRAALGSIVFGDDRARRDLEAIIHPAVRARGAELEAQAGADAVVIHVIPLLLESGRHAEFDHVIVVDADPEVQLKRIQDRDGLDAEQAAARMRAQADRQQRLGIADIVITNHGDLDELMAQTERVWEKLCREGPPTRQA